MAFDRSALGWSSLTVVVNGKPTTMKVANMSDAQIMAALKLPANAKALAAGWYRDGDKIYKRAATPAPTSPSTPAPTPNAPSTPAPARPPIATGFDRNAVAWDALNVIVNGKPTTMKVANMTDAQIRAALQLPSNAKALAPGWYVEGDKVFRRNDAPPAPATPAPPPIGAGPTPGDGGYLKVRQKQPDGSWKVVTIHRSRLSKEQLERVMRNGLNGGPASPAPGTTPPAGGGGSTTPTTGTAPGGTPPTTGTPPAPSWIPPMVGLGGLNADPRTGKIDWSKLISTAQEISAVDPEYAQDLSNNIWQAMQGVAPMQAEIQSLTTVDPTTGKTLYQSLFDNAMTKFGQNTSSSLSNAAQRGILSSGMVNSTLSGQAAENQQQIAGYGKSHGNARIADLLRGMTEQLQQQDTNFTSSYYNALSRAHQRIPAIPTLS